MACPACGTPARAGARFCVACGEPLPHPSHTPGPDVAVAPAPSPATCRGCDQAIDRDLAYCPRCGIAAPARARRAAHLEPSARRPEGWYPDPFGRSRTRWWDGESWAAFVADDDVHWDPLAFDDPRRPGLPGLGVALLGVVGGIALGFPITFALHEAGEPGGRAVLVLVSALTLWTGLAAALVFVARRRGSGSVVADYGLAFRVVDVPLGVAGWVAGRLFGGILAAPIVALWPDLEPEDPGILEDTSGGVATWVVVALVVVIGAPLVEELFFRGLLQPRLVERWGTIGGIALTSALFGAAHLIGWVGPVTFVYAAALAGAGVVLGILRHVTDRLGPCITAHAFFNIQALVVLALAG